MVEVEVPRNKFLSPHELSTPKGCEGWEEMYPSFYLFSPQMKEYEEKKFWFLDNVHNPYPVPPFDVIWLEAWQIGLNQMTTRVLMIPQAKGIDHRIINGYFYVSPTVADWADSVTEKRAEEFRKRSAFYYENWDRLYNTWYQNMQNVINDARNVEVRLPNYVDLTLDYLGNKSVSPAHILHVNFRHLVDLAFEAEAQRHFELANLAYASLLTFMDFMKQKFPSAKESTIVKMVQGSDTLMLRPDEELRKLAKLAYELKLGRRFAESKTWEELVDNLKTDAAGSSWLESYANSEYPWFYVHSGPTPNREYFYFKSWVEEHSFPFMSLKSYVGKLEKSENIDRKLGQLIEERERIREEYRDLLGEEEVETFDKLLKLSEKTYRFAEDHVFIVSNWFRTIFYLKVGEFAKLLVGAGYLDEVDDLYYLHYTEVESLLRALEISWATMNPLVTPSRTKQLITKRKAILEKLGKARAPPALGVPPKEVTDPYMIMLWGITGEKIRDWLSAQGIGSGVSEKSFRGFAASSGVVEGVARVVMDQTHLNKIQEGEILVCPITSPNWGPFLPIVKAIVTDIGGIMSHAAIIAREYGVPAVVGTGLATRLIKDGERIRVDGSDGKVDLLD
jgi:pyruvate, water dikinase